MMCSRLALLIMLIGCLGPWHSPICAEGSVRTVTTGQQLYEAFADQLVATIELLHDIDLGDPGPWAANSSKLLPLELKRSVVLRGGNGAYPQINFRYLANRIRVPANTSITLQGIMLKRSLGKTCAVCRRCFGARASEQPPHLAHLADLSRPILVGLLRVLCHFERQQPHPAGLCVTHVSWRPNRTTACLAVRRASVLLLHACMHVQATSHACMPCTRMHAMHMCRQRRIPDTASPDPTPPRLTHLRFTHVHGLKQCGCKRPGGQM